MPHYRLRLLLEGLHGILEGLHGVLEHLRVLS
jgi:hypothetical protein